MLRHGLTLSLVSRSPHSSSRSSQASAASVGWIARAGRRSRTHSSARASSEHYSPVPPASAEAGTSCKTTRSGDSRRSSFSASSSAGRSRSQELTLVAAGAVPLLCRSLPLVGHRDRLVACRHARPLALVRSGRHRSAGARALARAPARRTLRSSSRACSPATEANEPSRPPAVERTRRRRSLALHAATFGILNLVLVVIWAGTTRGRFWPVDADSLRRLPRRAHASVSSTSGRISSGGSG